MGSRASRRRTGGIVGLVAVAHELSSGTAQRIIIFDRRFRFRSNLHEEIRNFVACNARVILAQPGYFTAPGPAVPSGTRQRYALRGSKLPRDQPCTPAKQRGLRTRGRRGGALGLRDGRVRSICI